MDKDRFWSKGNLCPTCPWLASIGHPEAGLRDAFGAASRRDLVAKSLTPILVVPLQDTSNAVPGHRSN
jgi:hypothetical protein